MSINIQLERFEGPLGLLLYLIRKEEMDIFDINVHHITRQYLEYIREMKRLDLEVAGEFVSMASTLIHIKARMLLPQYNEEGEILEYQDPRKELVQKLLEYQIYQEASEKLNDRPLVGRDVLLRGKKTQIEAPEEDLVVEDNPLFSLIKAYRHSIKNMKQSVHKVLAAMQSIAERVAELKVFLPKGRKVILSDLIQVKEAGEQKHAQVLITFLSLLELCKLGFVSLFQSEPMADLHVEAKKDINEQAIQGVEDFDNTEEKQGLLENMMKESSPLEFEKEIDLDSKEANEDVELKAEKQLSFDQEDTEEPLSEEEMATDEEILEEERRLNLQEV